eukprot:jgi/Tetstr1/459293/TSEL_004692.t1
MAEEDGAMNTVIVKSKIDNRYSADEIVTHDGCRRPCYAVSTLAELRKVLGDKQYQDVQVVAIDEGQFFDDLREYCQAAVDVERKTVLVAGLSGDFRRRPNPVGIASVGSVICLPPSHRGTRVLLEQWWSGCTARPRISETRVLRRHGRRGGRCSRRETGVGAGVQRSRSPYSQRVAVCQVLAYSRHPISRKYWERSKASSRGISALR